MEIWNLKLHKFSFYLFWLRLLYIYNYISYIIIYMQSCVQVHELPQNHCGDNREGTLFSWLHINYTYLASVKFEHSVCRGSLMTTYIYITYILFHLYILKNNCIFRKKMSFGQFYILWHWIQTLVFTLLH